MSVARIRNSGFDRDPFLKVHTNRAMMHDKIASPIMIGEMTIFSAIPIIGNWIALEIMSAMDERVVVRKRIIHRLFVGI